MKSLLVKLGVILELLAMVLIIINCSAYEDKKLSDEEKRERFAKEQKEFIEKRDKNPKYLGSDEQQLAKSEESILLKFEKAGIWKVDRNNHRCLVDPGVWNRFPFEQKEQCLQLIYAEEKTWWKLCDMYSGKLLGKVSSWGWKVYP